MKTPVFRRGATLLEVIITCSLFSLMAISIFAILRLGLRASNNVESRYRAQRQLRRVELLITDDLKSTSAQQLDVKGVRPAGTPLSSVDNGHAVWFLSAEIPNQRAPSVAADYPAASQGEIARDAASGDPIWQTNVLYYLTVPGDYTGPGSGVADSWGLDTSCPQKLLIKKVLDVRDQSSDPFDITNAEVLLTPAQIDGYVKAPNPTYNLAGISEPQVVPGSLQAIANELLYFRVDLSAAPVVEVNCKALRLQEALNTRGRSAGILGSTDLSQDAYTIEYVSRLVPGN